MSISNTFFRISTEAHAKLYRLLGGKGLGGGDQPGAVIVVTTTGRKTGKKRPKPLMHLKDNGNYVVVGSAGGGDHHPAWFYNMEAKPDVTVQDQDRVVECTATIEREGEVRDALWERFKATDERFAKYDASTERKIPVVVLTPK